MKKKLLELLAALLSGAVTGLAFPKTGWLFLAWISLIPLLILLIRRPPAAAFRLGWGAGFAFYAVLLYWIPAVPMHYGGLSPILSMLTYIAFALFLGLFWALPALVFARIHRARPGLSLALFPFIWVAFEYILTHILTGFPWGLLGNSQHRNLWFIQMCAVTGVYGLSLILVGFQALIVQALRRRRRAPLWLALGMAAAIHGAGFICLNAPPETGDRFRAAVVQGNVGAETDFGRISLEENVELLERHIDLSRVAAEQGARLIVWPELSVPLCFSCDFAHYPDFSRRLHNQVSLWDATLLLGTSEITYEGDRTLYFNAAACLTPDGGLNVYHKRHLVPFGEYTPYKFIFSFISNFTHAIGELTPGDRFVLHSHDHIPFGSPICYEIIFPALVRGFTREGARFLVTITNDGWYGTSSAPFQHFAMAVLRAVENRRYVLRAATTGISGIIDPYGRIIERSKLYTRDVLSCEVTPRADLTPYVRFGDVLPLLSLTISGIFLILALLKKRQ